MSKKGLLSSIIISAILFVAGAVLFCFALSSFSSRINDNFPGKRHIELNKFLDNSMSEFEELKGLDKKVRNYMAQWNINGASLCIMRNDSLLYAKGYGWADKENGEEMEPRHLLRVASVSKLITAVGIMVLCEKGELSLDSKVFGEDGILDDEEYTALIKDKRYFTITVEDLLRHRAGFTQRAGDPMFSTITVMNREGLDTPPDNRTLLKCCLKRSLGYAPRTGTSYSNLGYMILSLVIEKVSGQDYEHFINMNVLRPAGCYDMHIAGNFLKDRRKGESRYYCQSNDPEVPEYTNNGKMVTRCYGGNDIKALSGAGAWISSVPELCRLVASINGLPGIEDIISSESIAEMTRATDKDTYSLGWVDTNEDGVWTRTGTFSGTSALIKHYPDGECWIMVSNTSTWKGPIQTKYTSSLFRDLRTAYSSKLPKRNLFDGLADED